MLSGVRENTSTERTAITITMTTPTTAAPPAKPSAAISATQSGENTTPPMLAPL